MYRFQYVPSVTTGSVISTSSPQPVTSSAWQGLPSSGLKSLGGLGGLFGGVLGGLLTPPPPPGSPLSPPGDPPGTPGSPPPASGSVRGSGQQVPPISVQPGA